jgi:hypothetical protein
MLTSLLLRASAVATLALSPMRKSPLNLRIAFVVATLLIKTINKADIENLRSMAGGLGGVGKIFVES